MSRPQKIIPPVSGSFDEILGSIAKGNNKLVQMPPSGSLIIKSFVVHFKDKKDAAYKAYSYTFKDGNFWFHKTADKSDFESFAVASEVTGIDEGK